MVKGMPDVASGRFFLFIEGARGNASRFPHRTRLVSVFHPSPRPFGRLLCWLMESDVRVYLVYTGVLNNLLQSLCTSIVCEIATRCV